MEIDNCHHEWDYAQNEYLPVVESIKKHHPCKDCGLINNHPQTTQLKTGKLIALIKEMFEKNDVPRGQIRDHIEKIKQMKRDGTDDHAIIYTIMSNVCHRHNSDAEYSRWD
ncbi:hypothetical protein ACT9XH_01915 [Methanococcoides methylutens]|uniref:hypothetical protein n=1 Tax=Methanococcoides methylutens TaxID=2226 RepID=UPI0040443DAE